MNMMRINYFSAVARNYLEAYATRREREISSRPEM